MLLSISTAVISFVSIFPQTVFASEYLPVSESYKDLGLVQCPKYLNIRSSPTKNSSIIGLIENNGACKVMKLGEDWHAIQSGTITGYVQAQYLFTGKKAYTKAEEVAVDQIEFTELGVIYSDMDTESKVWEKPFKGSIYDVISDTGYWIKVDLDGGVGYVPDSGNIKRFKGLPTANPTYNVSGVSANRRSIIQYVMQFLGNKYVWGGTNPYTGADCSGLVQYSYLHCLGIGLPRVSYEQAKSGQQVTSMEMRPGDLVFYADSSGTIGHVAIYIGNGTILHAASTKSGVKLSPWNYRTPKLIRNVIGD